jgi:hypothetical protein
MKPIADPAPNPQLREVAWPSIGKEVVFAPWLFKFGVHAIGWVDAPRGPPIRANTQRNCANRAAYTSSGPTFADNGDRLDAPLSLAICSAGC